MEIKGKESDTVFKAHKVRVALAFSRGNFERFYLVAKPFEVLDIQRSAKALPEHHVVLAGRLTLAKKKREVASLIKSTPTKVYGTSGT